MVPSKMERENNSLQSRMILECQELCDQYKLCRARLHQLAKEVEALRQENSDLRSANGELVEHLSLLSEDKMREINFLSYDFQRLSVGEEVCDISPTSVIHRKGFRRNIVDGVSLPKSISVRSSFYLKMNHSGRSNKAASPQPLNNPIARATCGREQPRSHGPRGRSSPEKEKQEALEMEVYNQGMLKTELCNKWQETGMCPYGDLCQFAHGITELRPIIRHPRYKTEVCRMVLAGATCPYGHRCHFRHSLCPP